MSPNHKKSMPKELCKDCTSRVDLISRVDKQQKKSESKHWQDNNKHTQLHYPLVTYGAVETLHQFVIFQSRLVSSQAAREPCCLSKMSLPCLSKGIDYGLKASQTQMSLRQSSPLGSIAQVCSLKNTQPQKTERSP